MGIVLGIFAVVEDVTYVQLSIASITWCITISWMLPVFLWKSELFENNTTGKLLKKFYIVDTLFMVIIKHQQPQIFG